MEHITFWKAVFSAVTKFPHFMGFDVHYPVHKSPLFVSVLSQFNSPQFYSISYRSIWILFSHLHMGLHEVVSFLHNDCPFYQIDAQILYFNTFITLLYMFRALFCSSSGGQIVLTQPLVSSLSLGDCSVHRLQEDCRNLWSEQSPKQSVDTRCCVNTIVLLKMSTIVLETCTGIY